MLTPLELRDIRDQMRQLFGVPNNLALVAATLNNALGEQLTQLANRAQALQEWAATISCPIPHAFGAGASIVQELLNRGAAAGRLLAFHDQIEPLTQFAQRLDTLERFRNEQGDRFRAVRDFFNGMVNTETDLEAVRRFILDYRTLEQERTVSEPARWHELNQSYQAAQAAVDGQIRAWRTQVEEHMAGLNDNLEDAVRGVGVPADQVRDEAAALSGLYEGVRRRLAQDAHSWGEARGWLTDLYRCEQDKADQLRELRERYGRQLPVTEHPLTWSDLPAARRLATPDEVDAWLEELRRRLQGYLDDGQTVVIP